MKKQWSLYKFSLKIEKIAIITNFLAFSIFIWIQEGKLMRIHANPDPQPCYPQYFLRRCGGPWTRAQPGQPNCWNLQYVLL